jgi:hypothetical protein
MTKSTKPDLTDQETQRLNTAPLREKRNEFILFNCLDFKFEMTFLINISLDYISEIIGSIVFYTNNVQRKAQDLSKTDTQANYWYLTYIREIYFYLAIRIYITLFIIDKITDY